MVERWSKFSGNRESQDERTMCGNGGLTVSFSSTAHSERNFEL